MWNTFMAFFGKVSKFTALSIPIITLIGMLIPKIRQHLKNLIKNFIGLSELNHNIKKLHEDVELTQKRTAKIEESVKMHVQKDEEKMQAQMFNLKDSLMRSFNFYIDRGYITLEELDTLQDVYTSYRKFGGNGVFKALWEDKIVKLPNQPPNIVSKEKI